MAAGKRKLKFKFFYDPRVSTEFEMSDFGYRVH